MHPEQCCGELQRGTGLLLSSGTAWGWKCCCQRGCGTACASCASCLAACLAAPRLRAATAVQVDPFQHTALPLRGRVCLPWAVLGWAGVGVLSSPRRAGREGSGVCSAAGRRGWLCLLELVLPGVVAGFNRRASGSCGATVPVGALPALTAGAEQHLSHTLVLTAKCAGGCRPS